MKHIARPLAFHKTLKPTDQYTYTGTIGNRVYTRARKSDGSPVFIEQEYRPTYYLPLASQQADQATHWGFDGTPLMPHECDTIFEGKEFVEQYTTVYGDIQPEYMALSDCYGTKDVPWLMEKLYIWDIDIEVDSEGGYARPQDPWQEVVTITVLWRHMEQMGIVVYGRKDYTPAEGVTYIKCNGEAELLMRFLDDWKADGDYPDIVTGWNVQFFDIPYLIARMKTLFTNDIVSLISPFERFAERTITIYGRAQQVVDIRGVAILDYLEMYKKLTYTQQENYRLDTIAHIELGKKKLSYKEYRSLAHLYRENHQKFVDYNINDVVLVDELDQKKKLLALVCAIAYTAMSNFVDTFKQVRLWDIMIYHRLRADGKQIPPRKSSDKKDQYAGAYVKVPTPGLYPWVVSFDVASMYPHIIRQWNLSPETLCADHVPGLTVKGADGKNTPSEALLSGEINLAGFTQPGTKDVCVAANGVLTRRDVEGFLPAMLKTLYTERNRYKKFMQAAKVKLEALKQTPTVPHYQEQVKKLQAEIASCDNAQTVRKVNLNSAYGALGSEYFRFFDIRIAEAVTVTGQLVIQRVARDINRFMNRVFKTDQDYIIYSDTDSVYVNMASLVQRSSLTDPARIVEMLHQFCEAKMAEVIRQSLEEIADYMNVAVPCLTMPRDVIADKGVWTAKKRYVLNVYDKEGRRLENPELYTKGLETIKSSTPAICREMLTHAMSLLMNGTQQELWSYVVRCEQEFKQAPFEDVAFPRSINGLKTYANQDKSVPIAVRGAKAFNEGLIRTGLQKYYEPLVDGEKIKFAYVRPENPFFTHVMSAPDGCPPEWNIEQYLDYDTQFMKSFLEPLKTILAAAGWTLQFEDSLFD
jgi:DNA polymerase elongation subunit (family B)